MVNKKNLNAIKFMAFGDITAAQLAGALAEVNAMTIDEYALGFGGLIVPEEHLIAYKEEYAAHLAGLLAKKEAA